MVLNQSSGALMPSLRSLLKQMDTCAQDLEAITQREYEAIRSLDAEQILQAGQQRMITHQYLGELEQQMRQLLAQHQVSSQLPISAVIDMYADDQTSELQSLRNSLHERMLKIDQHSQENRMRLHAAYSISSTILQGLGLSPAQQTYNRRLAE